MKYQTKTKYVEALQWTGTNLQEIKDFMSYQYTEINQEIFYPSIVGRLKKLEVGDFIIKSCPYFIGYDEPTFLKRYELSK